VWPKTLSPSLPVMFFPLLDHPSASALGRLQFLSDVAVGIPLGAFHDYLYSPSSVVCYRWPVMGLIAMFSRVEVCVYNEVRPHHPTTRTAGCLWVLVGGFLLLPVIVMSRSERRHSLLYFDWIFTICEAHPPKSKHSLQDLKIKRNHLPP
jgi:hypothetical protein